MKNILTIFIILSKILFANEIYKDEDIFIQNGKAYFLKNDVEVSGTVSSVGNNNITYSIYVKGNISKVKILNFKRELISEYTMDSNGLINGKASIYNENGEVIIGQYKNGIINGEAKQEYYDEFDFEGQFLSGVAHGKIKAIDLNGNKIDYIYSNGIPKKQQETFLFDKYFNKEFVKIELLKNEKNQMKKDGKLFTGLGVKSERGLVTEGIYYLEGIKKAQFNFQDGFMTSLRIYKSTDNYEENLFYSEMNKGVLNSQNIYLNGQLNGKTTEYFLNGERQEGNYVNGELNGKVIYYNFDNKIIEIRIYDNKTYNSISYYDYEKNKISKKSEWKFSYELLDWINTGTATFFNENGYIDEEMIYGDNNKVASKVYYPNGKIKITGEIDVFSDFYIGNVTEYYESGIIKTLYNYSKGYLDGNQYYYDNQGKQIKVEKYDYGTLVN